MSDALIHDAQRLKELQALPLSRKILITQTRIIEWYQHFNGCVCVSFSGGKDSTVLLDIVRKIYPHVPAVFSNTGLEYPEIQKFVKGYDNVDIVIPEMRFDEVIKTYGYPLIGKEVAEAIHYARRIRGPEREQEERTSRRKKADLSGSRTAGEGQNSEECFQWTKHSTDSPECSNVLEENRTPREKDATPHKSRGTQTNRGSWNTYEPKQRVRWILSGFRSAAGVEPFKSQFNKEKWLPLARDLPALISHYCCEKMKKSPMHKYQRKHKYYPILGTLAEESRVRKQAWIRHGCNLFEGAKASSQPMSFWTEQDVLQYISDNHLPIVSVYGEVVGEPGNLHCTGCERTGCIFCAFGAHLEKGETRFQRLAKTHPRQYDYCIGGGEWVKNPYYDPDAPEYDGEWKNWNPEYIWSASKKGLGMGKLFEMVNDLYGKELYRW